MSNCEAAMRGVHVQKPSALIIGAYAAVVCLLVAGTIIGQRIHSRRLEFASWALLIGLLILKLV